MNLQSAKDYEKSLHGAIFKKNWVCIIARLSQHYSRRKCVKTQRRVWKWSQDVLLYFLQGNSGLSSRKGNMQKAVSWVKTVADLFGMWRNLCRKSKLCCSFYLKKVAQKQKLWYTSKAICVKKVSLRLQMEVEQCSTLFYCLPTRRMWCLELKLLLRWLLLFVRYLSFALSSCNRATATVWKPSAAHPNPTIPKRTTAKTHLPVVMQNLNSGHTSAREFWQFAVLCSSFFPYCKRKRVEQLSNSIALFFVPKRFEKALFNVRDCADNVMQICH